MRLADLKLTNYRNCKELSLNFDSDKILIIGKNAQGKTNILESIYLLSALKSPRTSNNIELINFESDTADVHADIIKADTDIELDFAYNKEKKRELKINGVKSRPKDFKTVLKTVLFSTTDLLLLRGTPQDRRDWLDRAISQIYPAYDDRLSKYDKIRIQKNNYLKEYLKTGYTNDTLLEVYNEQLVITGSNIIYLRKKFLNEIEKTAKEKHRIISETEDLKITYDCSFLSGDENEIEEIAASFRNSLPAPVHHPTVSTVFVKSPTQRKYRSSMLNASAALWIISIKVTSKAVSPLRQKPLSLSKGLMSVSSRSCPT